MSFEINGFVINLLMILVIAALIAGAVIGAVKGFVKMAVSLLGFAATILLTIIFAPLVQNLVVKKTSWRENIADSIESGYLKDLDTKALYEDFAKASGGGLISDLFTFDQLFGEQGAEIPDVEVPGTEAPDTENPGGETPGTENPGDETPGTEPKEGQDESSITNRLTRLPGFVKTMLWNWLKDVDLQSDGAKRQIALKMGDTVLAVGSYIAVFIVAALLVFLVGHLLNLASKLPGLNALNRILGFAMGLLVALIIVDLFFIVVQLLSPYHFTEPVLKMMEESSFLKFLTDYNIVSWLFSLVVKARM